MSRFSSIRCRRGAASLEFGLVAAALIIAVLAAFEISRYVTTQASLRVAVTEVSRRALVDTTLTNSTATTYALARAPVLQSSLLTMTIARNAAVNPPTVAVSASYSFSFVIPVFGTTNKTLTAAITTPVQ